MLRYLIIFLLAAVLSSFSTAQDSEPAAAAEPAAETLDEAADEAVEEEVDDSDLDDNTYQENEDDFIPTEEIPADEPIPFPSNI